MAGMKCSVADSQDMVIFFFSILERMGASLTRNVHQALAVLWFAEWGPQTGSPGIFSLITPGWWDVQQGSVPSPPLHSQQAESGITLLCCDLRWSCFDWKTHSQKNPSKHGCLDTASVVKWWFVTRVIVPLTWVPQGTESWPRRCSRLKSAIWCCWARGLSLLNFSLVLVWFLSGLMTLLANGPSAVCSGCIVPCSKPLWQLAKRISQQQYHLWHLIIVWWLAPHPDSTQNDFWAERGTTFWSFIIFSMNIWQNKSFMSKWLCFCHPHTTTPL